MKRTDNKENHKLFTIGRKFAYSLKAKSLREDNSETFSLQAISDYLTENNNKSLPISEIRSISKSIFKYVNKNLSKEGLIAWQVKRTKASNRKATERSQAKRKLAARLYENGYPIKEISKEFDISYSIVRVAVSHKKHGQIGGRSSQDYCAKVNYGRKNGQSSVEGYSADVYSKR